MFSFIRKIFGFNKKKKSYGTITYYPAYEAWRDYMEGTITLEEFSKVKECVVTKPIQPDDKEIKK